jgi:hypothetical protein
MVHVFVSNDLKYFKVSAQDCCRSPCIEISRFTTHMNIVSTPIYFITSLTSASIALSLTIGNIPFEFSIKSHNESLEILQNVASVEDVLRIAKNVTNIYMYQTLYGVYARALEDQGRQIATLTSELQQQRQQQQQQQNQDDEVNNYLVESSFDNDTGLDFLDLDLGDLSDYSNSEPIDKFIDDLFNNNIHNTMDIE